MNRRRSLRARILLWLATFALPLAGVIALHGFFVNEYAERLLWDSLVQTEFDRHLERSEKEVQQITDKKVAEIDQHIASKEKEITTI